MNARLGPSWPETKNPWNTLKQILQAVDAAATKAGSSTGLSGSSGCAVPIAPFITALQCFRCDTASLAPLDLCIAIQKVCADPHNAAFGCEVPIDFAVSESTPDGVAALATATCTDPTWTSAKQLDYWSKKKDVFRGTAWYWLDDTALPAFGTECGQYGMDPWAYGKNEAMGQYVCSTPGAEVPCVPGQSPDSPASDIPTPATVIGDMVQFYGRTSGAASRPQTQVCSAATGTNCADTPGVPLPIGVPPEWSRTAPNYWVHGNRLYRLPTDQYEISLDVSLYVNGFALGSDVQEVSPGQFVTNVPPGAPAAATCGLEKGSADGTANMYVQNTGTVPASYVVKFTGCVGALGQKQIDVSADGLSEQFVPVEPGQIRGPVQFSLEVPAGAAYDSCYCSFTLEAAAVPGLVLDEAGYGCVVNQGKRSPRPPGTGINAPNIQEGTACRTSDFWCNIFNGNRLDSVVYWLGMTLLLVGVSLFMYAFIRYARADAMYEQELRLAQKNKENAMALDVETSEELSLLQQEKADERAAEVPKDISEGILDALQQLRGVGSAPATPAE
jgi:hypothetical protein